MHNYYYILGIADTATAEEIQRAYYKLAVKFHPDKNNGDAYYTEMFKQIQEAYDILSDPAQRAKYDRQRKVVNTNATEVDRTGQHTDIFTARRSARQRVRILDFSAKESIVRSGDQVTLHWVTVHADKVEIDLVGPVQKSGETTFTVPQLSEPDLVLELRAYDVGAREYVAEKLYLRNGHLIDERKNAEREKFRAAVENRVKPRLMGIHPEVLKNKRLPRLAPIGYRALALVIDSLLVGLLATVLAQLTQNWISFDPGLYFLPLWLLYGAWFESSFNRGTPGKYLLYLEVQHADGTKMSFGKAFLRNGLKLFSGALLGIGFLMAMWDKQQRTLHDRAAGTLVAEMGWGKVQRGEWPEEVPVEVREE